MANRKRTSGKGRLLSSTALTKHLATFGALGLAFSATSAHALDANALPTDPNVVGGNATFNQSGATLTVNQTTNRTVIDWRSFDIGSNATTNFVQPGASSIAVNRVNGSANPTEIQGTLNANGQVWILNPNGVFFGKNAKIDVAGILASTANIDANAFMRGDNRLQFTGGDSGSVENAGLITVADGGLAAFVAPAVRNSGVIRARLGKVTLAAGTTYTLDLAGDQLVELGIGSNDAVVDQSGQVLADGSIVTLTAKAATEVVDSIVNVSGTVQASGIEEKGGKIILTADNVTTGPDATLAADGGTNGDGGSIYAYADKTGTYNGSFSAKGGSASGNGGSIETSGKSVDIQSGLKVDATAANGATGSWTIDPTDLTIDSGNVGTYETNLNTTNVNLLADNSITLNTDFDTSGQSNSNTLNFQDEGANNDLTINLNGKITLAGTQSLTGEGTIVNVGASGSIQNGVDVASTGANIDVSAGTYDGGINVNKQGLTLTGATGAVIDVLPATGTPLNGINVNANDVTVQGFEIAGEITGSYLTYAFDNTVSRGIAVSNGVTNFTITDNNIHNVRNGVLIDGRNTGSLTNNIIDNTKGAVSIQYTDAGAGNTEGYSVTMTGNSEGAYGNEWGVNVHLNGFYDDATTSTGYHSTISTKIATNAPTSVQEALLANSAANGGWTVQDQGYSYSNRTSVVVDTSGSSSNQGSARSPLDTIANGVNAVVAGGTVNVNAGAFALGASTLNITKSLSLIGAGEGSTTITSATTGSSYGMYVGADNVTLSGFTFSRSNGNGGYMVHVSPGGPASSRLLNFVVDHVTIDGSNTTGLDLNGVKGATIDNVTVENTINGNGISLTDSADIIVTNTTTTNNAWGGLAIYQANNYYNQQVDKIVIDGSNSFANGVYAQNQSLDYSALGTINLTGLGIQYVASISTGGSDGDYWFFQSTEQGALNLADAFNTRYSQTGAVVQGYTEADKSVDGNNTFYVGHSTRSSNALSIAAAISAAASGGTVNIDAGTFNEAFSIDKNIDIEGAGIGQTIIQPTSLISTGTTHKYTSDMQAAVFVNGASDVTISGVTIDGNGLNNDALIFWNDSSGTISNALLTNVRPFSGEQTGQGIAVDGSGGSMSLNVSNVTIQDYNKNAIDVINGNGGTTGGSDITLNVTDSTFIGRGTTGTIAQNGVVLWERAGGTINATIDGTSFSDLAYSDPNSWTAAGVLVYGSPNGTTSVSNSNFTNVQDYIDLAGGSTNDIDATTGNTFDGVAQATATLSDFFSYMSHVNDGLTEAGNGLVRLKADNIYLTAANGGIQTAVDVAQSGDTINVQTGTYSSGAVAIDKNLSIVGDSGAKAVFTPGQDFTTSDASGAWFSVGAGVTFNLSNVVFDGSGFNVWQGLRSLGNTTIDSVDFRNIQGSASGSPYRGVAIESFGGKVVGGAGSDTNGSGGSDSHLIVTNSTFEQIGREGILIKGTGATADIIGNTYTGKGTGDFLDYGIEVGAHGQATITGNTITGNLGEASDGSTSAGILVTSYYGGASSATIENNNITGNTTSVAVGYDGSDTSVVHASDNDFSGNTYGVMLTSTSAVADFSGNWWGTTDASAIEASMGGAEAAAVDFSPFLTSGTDTDEGTAGFQGDFSTLDVTTLGGGGGSRINEAISLVNAGGTVNVGAGTYDSVATSIGGTADITIQTTEDAVIDGSTRPSNNRIVDLRADGTTFSGFTINNGGGNGVGVSVTGQGVTVSGNNISDVLTGVQTTTQYSAGNATISGNTIDAKYGVSLQNTGNEVSGNDVTASVEGVGLLTGLNTFTDNTFHIGSSANALVLYSSASANDLTSSGNTVNIEGGALQGAVYLAGTDGNLNLAAGTYGLSSTLNLKNDGLTVTGADEANTVINSTAVGYGIAVQGDGITLSTFTFNNTNPDGYYTSSNTSGASYAVKVSPLGAAPELDNFSINYVTINDSGRTGLDLNGVNGATIDHVTVDGSVYGNGITLTDSANVGITNSTTTNNAWGGLALYQANFNYNLQVTGITVDGTNSFANGVYAQDQSGTNHFGTIDLTGLGIQYVASISTGGSDGDYWFFQSTEQGALNLADAFNTRYSQTGAVVQGYSESGKSVDGNGTFYVGHSTDSGNALSIAAAQAASSNGATINVGSGTYAEDVTVGDARVFNFDGSTLNSFTQNVASSIGGALTTVGNIALNALTTLASNTVLNGTNVSVDSVDGAGHTFEIASGATTLTGSSYQADGLTFGGTGVTLSQANTTFDTSSVGGDITFNAPIFGTTNAAQSIVLNAGPGTGGSANGDISLQNVGLEALKLGSMTVSGHDLTANTVWLATNYTSTLTGNQTFSTETLHVGGNATSNVGGNATGPIVSGGTVNVSAGGNFSGNVTAPNSTISAQNISGTFTGANTTLNATNSVNVTTDVSNLTVDSPSGTVNGTFDNYTSSGGPIVVNGKTRSGSSETNPNQIVVEGFTLPNGAIVTSTGEIVLPSGMLVGLVSPAAGPGAEGGKPKVIIVHTVMKLGELLSQGYVAIIVDLNKQGDDEEVVAMN